MFADDKCLFSVVHDIDTSANDLNHDLDKISEWAFQWKMNPEPTKQDQEIIFSKKKTVSIHLVGYFNNSLVNSTATHKHLGMIIDSKLSYENHLQSVFSRVNKTIGLLRKFQPTLPRKSIRGTSPEKLFQELGLETLKLRGWFRKFLYVFFMNKLKKNYLLIFFN